MRKPYRTIYPARADTSEISGEALSAPKVDPDKRPKEQVENDQPISAQVRRAKEQGRGRRATSPWQIPWAGWKDILWRVYASINDNRLLAVAGGVVFYSLLAIFPAIAAFVSLYGLIADASTIDSHLSMAAGVFPAGAVDILHEQIMRLTAKTDAKLGLGFITGLAIALWSANAGMKGIIDALNVVYDEKEKRSFVKLNLLSLLFTLDRNGLAHDRHCRSGRRPDRLFGSRPFVFPEPCDRRPALAVIAGPCRGWPWPRSIAMGQAAPKRAGNGFRSGAPPQPSGG